MSDKRKNDAALLRALEAADTVVDPPRAENPEPSASAEEKQKAEWAARASLLYGDEDDDEDVDDAAVDRLVTGLDRRIAASRGGPKVTSRNSDGGANVAYASTAKPFRGRRLRDPTGKVLVKDASLARVSSKAAELEAPTVLVERVLHRAKGRRRAWRMVLAGGVLLGTGGVVVLVRPWANDGGDRAAVSPGLSGVPTLASQGPRVALPSSTSSSSIVVVDPSGSSPRPENAGGHVDKEGRPGVVRPVAGTASPKGTAMGKGREETPSARPSVAGVVAPVRDANGARDPESRFQEEP